MQDNFRIDLKEIGYVVVDWFRLGEVVCSCEHGNEPVGSSKMQICLPAARL
jgi:hypothetical protein